jgi:hypothetical protein
MEALARWGRIYKNPYESDIEALKEEYAARKRRHIQRGQYIDMYTALTEAVKREAQCEGDRRLRRLKKILDEFQWARTKDQFLFHEDFIKLCLPHIYGSDFEANRLRLMKQFKLQSFKVGALVLCPRRWGKTIAVAMFVAAMLLVCACITIATFSSGQRASSGLMTKVVKFIYEIPGGSKRIVTKNEECFFVATQDQLLPNGELKASKNVVKDSGRINRLFAYPASSTGKSWFSCEFCRFVCVGGKVSNVFEPWQKY